MSLTAACITVNDTAQRCNALVYWNCKMRAPTSVWWR